MGRLRRLLLLTMRWLRQQRVLMRRWVMLEMMLLLLGRCHCGEACEKLLRGFGVQSGPLGQRVLVLLPVERARVVGCDEGPVQAAPGLPERARRAATRKSRGRSRRCRYSRSCRRCWVVLVVAKGVSCQGRG